MPEKGPWLFQIQEDVSIYGQKGGFSDSELTGLHLKPGDDLNISVDSDSGCVVLRTEDHEVYLPVIESVFSIFRRQMPSDKLRLEAQTEATFFGDIPPFLRNILCEMIETIINK